eukprot:GHVL01004587.1.p1 GENE.GHVL01004587.1~~GHVL01004587.1.p1  ORF type:complete len:424 (+),score=57.93 GHVL01004587.1:370-1641(+)
MVDAMAAQVVCKSGFALDVKGDVCTRSDHAPAQYKCSKGSLVQGDGRCLIKTAIPPTPTCPKGYKFSGSKDPITAIAAVPHGGLCVQLESIPASPNCKGSTKDKTQSCSWTCSAGMSLNPISHMCIGGNDLPIQWACPSNYFLVNNQCVANEYTPATLTCPKGSTFDATSNYCFQERVAQPVYQCPPGYTQQSSGASSQCTREDFEDPIFQCAYNQLLTGKECLIRDYVEPNIQCPHGFQETDLHGCVSAEYQSLMLSCPEGFITAENETKCVRATSVSLDMPTSGESKRLNGFGFNNKNSYQQPFSSQQYQTSYQQPFSQTYDQTQQQYVYQETQAYDNSQSFNYQQTQPFEYQQSDYNYQQSYQPDYYANAPLPGSIEYAPQSQYNYEHQLQVNIPQNADQPSCNGGFQYNSRSNSCVPII